MAAFSAASLLLGVILTAALVAITPVSGAELLAAITRTKSSDFAVVVGLMALSTVLAAEKWHAVANASGLPLKRSSSFYLTAAGVGIGQVLPPQIAVAAMRGLGARRSPGSAFAGIGTSIVEQAFDVLIFAILLVASAATYCVNGGGGTWLAFAVTGLGSGWLGIVYAARVWTKIGTNQRSRAHRILRRFGSLIDLLTARSGLARYLFLLSAARYVVLVVCQMAIGSALGIHISPWQIAASLPFPMLAGGLLATPGGVGTSEWTMMGALTAFGVPLEAALPWVIGSRLLSFAGGVTVAAMGVAIAAFSNRAVLSRSA